MDPNPSTSTPPASTDRRKKRQPQSRRRQRHRRLQDDDPWAGIDDPFSDLRDDADEEDEEDGEDGPALEPAFLSASECFDLQLSVQGALILQDACHTNGPAFVQAKVGKTTLATRRLGSGSSTPMWSEVLSFGCQAAEEALQIKLFTAGGNVECASWTMRDWLAQSAANPLAAKDSGEVAANTLVLPRSDARVNLMVSLASFAHPKTAENGKGWGMFSGKSTQDVVLGGVFAGLGFLLILAISISCCCWCCCPVYFRRRWNLGWGASAAGAATTAPAASATMVGMAIPPPAQQHPASVARPGTAAAATAGRRPSPAPYASAPSAPAAAAHGARPAHPASSLYDRPPPVAPTHYGAPVEAVAVAMPIAEPIDGYRGGYAEARIMRAESDARGGGGGGGKKGGGGQKR